MFELYIAIPIGIDITDDSIVDTVILLNEYHVALAKLPFNIVSFKSQNTFSGGGIKSGLIPIDVIFHITKIENIRKIFFTYLSYFVIIIYYLFYELLIQIYHHLKLEFLCWDIF